MEHVSGTWTVITMFGLRLVVPLLLIAAVAYLFKRVDLKWQNEAWAQQRAGLAQQRDGAGARWLEKLSQPCWDEMGCEESDYMKCPAHKQAGLPCWMARRWAEGGLPTKCYRCERFTMRPDTVPAH